MNLSDILPLGVSFRHLADFNKLLARVLERNMPLPESLACVAQAARSTRLRRAIQQVRAGVLEGKSLDEAMEAHPRIFPETYRAIVQAGFASGDPARILSFACVGLEAETKTWKIALPMLGYTVTVIMVLFVILLILRNVGADFKNMFDELGIMLPTSTRLVLIMLEHIEIALALVVLVPATAYLLWRLLLMNALTGRVVCSISIIGKALKAASLARLCALSGTLLEAGEPLNKAIRLCTATEANMYFRKVLNRLENAASDGKGLGEAAAAENFFPRTLVWMISVGEKRGTLPETLRSTARLYVKRVEGFTAPFGHAVATLLVVGVSCLIGFVVIGLFSPFLCIMGSM